MEKEPLRVLFLCTGNSARSQIGEALLRHMSRGQIEVVSAGSRPRPEIHPMAREAVKRVFGLDMEGHYPKPLDEFLGQRFDYIITVCDRAAESCPAFPEDPERIRWSFEDPAAVEGDEEKKQRAFEQTARDMAGRIRIWMSLPKVASRLTTAKGTHAV
jgi:ArsR family transcriptional regulator, arsenate/arsenite/antimonite-responsive transcriptional repressor / arsenate reductase (thioredoxin)